MMRYIATLLLSLSMLTACSDQYRIVNPGATPEEVEEAMDRIQSENPTTASLIGELRADPTSQVFFTKSGSNGLVAESVFSFGHVTPIMSEYSAFNREVNVFETGLTEATVIFVDGFDAAGSRHFALMLELRYDDNSYRSYAEVSYPGEYGFSDESFEALFPGTNGNTILLRTYDVDRDFAETLGTNVQFKVYEIVNGVEFEIGQFSTLAGFGS